MMHEFWKSAGFHLLEVNEQGWLTVTPDFLRAYFSRPEVHPVDESCDSEIALFEALMNDPFMSVDDARLNQLADEDARDNYRVVLRFRDRLASAGTLEGAYLELMRGERIDVPPVFVDQMVHVILRNILSDARDPIRLRAAELFFRDQNVSTDDGRVMLADDEIVEMYTESGGLGGLGQLLMESNTPVKSVELDVLDEDNKDIYWERSDRFDTVVDLRFTQPALDGLARVIEAWIGHFLGMDVRVQPMQRIDDEKWSWHVGLDAEANRILNALYEGSTVGLEEMQQIIALFTMKFDDANAVRSELRGKPVYLGAAMTPSGKLKLKPQNLLTNLPLGIGA